MNNNTDVYLKSDLALVFTIISYIYQWYVIWNIVDV